ncbi:hypothetical protein [Lentibacillus salicampi]|uniref:Uncharacterized protein n=1 Tax=Lentibacillus salicampi TaxID=175306 RepID=A0A4Y9A861_9BACI|nr:hypothetical protein [Lentibacillus salicampi]TFJ91412.1 hypothetical protein E4U82_17815 [Lentibacillus salicampi]
MSEQMIQQLNVYEYLGKGCDPLYNVICHMQQGYSECIPDINVTLTKNQHGLYELASESNHECYSNKEDLYDCVSKIINNSLLRGIS